METAHAEAIAFDEDGLHLPLSDFDNTGRGALLPNPPEPLEIPEDVDPEIIHARMNELLDHYQESDEVTQALIEAEILQLREALRALTVELARHDCNAFLEYCFSDKHGNEITQGEIHREWHAAIDNYDRVCIVAPRDHGKTEQVVIGRVLWELGRNSELRIKIVCQSDPMARKRLASIRDHLERNTRVQEVFPELVPQKGAAWSKHEITVKRKAFHRDPSVEARGILSSASGGRADLIIGDDAVDRRNALLIPALREQVKTAWWEDWTNLLEDDGRAVWICTVWHADDLSHEIMDRPPYFVVYHAIDEDLTPLWPEWWDRDGLKKRRAEIGVIAFDRAFRQIALSGEVVCIDADWIHYAVAPKADGLLRVDGYDLAIGQKAANDYFATVGIAVDPETAKIYVETFEQHRLSWHKQKRFVVDHWLARLPFRVAIEGTQYQRVLADEVVDIAPIPVETVHPLADKMTRLQRVSPYLENGRVFFDPKMNPKNLDPAGGDLISQLCGFPLVKHDDLVDAFVHAVQLAADLIIERFQAEADEVELNVIEIG